MDRPNDQIYEIVNTAIDEAVTLQKYRLNFYSFLSSEKLKRKEILSFLSSSLVSQIKDEISHINLYLTDTSDMKEVYGWMGKSRATVYKDYLMRIIDDAERYEQEKRPGRKKKSGTTNK